jgi:hypothetical protein
MLLFLKIFSPKNSAKELAVMAQNLIITLVFEKNAIFCRKLLKIGENCDHNIDPRSGNIARIKSWSQLQKQH